MNIRGSNDWKEIKTTTILHLDHCKRNEQRESKRRQAIALLCASACFSMWLIYHLVMWAQRSGFGEFLSRWD